MFCVGNMKNLRRNQMLLVTLSESAAILEGSITEVLGFKATLFVDKS